jgi:pimeloyl-ACP methyl ester carboxylesterase
MRDLARTMAEAASALGLDHFNLLGNSFGGRLALWLALEVPERIQALVLAAPAAILPENRPRIAAPESQAQLMYAHPERQPPRPPADPAVIAKQDALVSRLRGPNRDPNLESRLSDLNVPVLVLFGTKDRMIPPEMGRIYREQLPNCHYILVYDAGHAIDADRPEAFASVVRDFLQRHESFVVNQTSALINPERRPDPGGAAGTRRAHPTLPAARGEQYSLATRRRSPCRLGNAGRPAPTGQDYQVEAARC